MSCGLKVKCVVRFAAPDNAPPPVTEARASTEFSGRSAGYAVGSEAALPARDH